MRRVGMAKVYDFQLFALKTEGVSFEDFWRYELRWKLAREARLPDGSHKVRLDLVLNGRHNGCGGICSRVGKPVQQELQTEEMVTVRMGNVNSGEILSA